MKQDDEILPSLLSSRYNLTMKQKTTGFFLIGVAIVGWALFLLLPFTTLPNGAKAATMTTALVIAEVSFLIASFMLGKEYVAKFRRLGRRKKANHESN